MSDRESDRSPQPPPEGVRSTPGQPGPVPVRDLMRQMSPEPAGDPAAEPPDHRERAFDAEGQAWLARTAGTGAYGTGRRGTARLVAIHFYRADDPATPLREALLPAAAFSRLHPEELRELLLRATPIDLDR